MNESTLQAVLAGLAPQVRFFEVVGSTNDEALAWAENGALDGALVVADQQTAGRGRLGRRWVTKPGAALAFSMVLRPTDNEKAILPLFSPLGGLAVCLALQNCYHLAAEIKWPNDVLVQRRKVSGILAEANWLGQQLQAVVLGIGLNLNSAALPPAAELLYPATCVEDEIRRSMLPGQGSSQIQPVEREMLLAAIVNALQHWRAGLGTTTFLRAWEERLAFCGEWVHITQHGQEEAVEGLILGVNTDGNLLIKTKNGQEMSFAAGDVHLRPLEYPNDLTGGYSC